MRQQGGLHAEVAIACVFDPHGGCTGVLDGTARSHRHTVEGYIRLQACQWQHFSSYRLNGQRILLEEVPGYVAYIWLFGYSRRPVPFYQGVGLVSRDIHYCRYKTILMSTRTKPVQPPEMGRYILNGKSIFKTFCYCSVRTLVAIKNCNRLNFQR